MRLYTIVLDYKGGTYISQIKGNSPQEACIVWAKELNTKQIHSIGEKSKQKLIANLQDEDNELVPVETVESVWCTGTSIRGSYALLNIIETVSNP